jgi:putative endonuclease
MYEHKNKLLNGFSKYYNLNKLVYIDSTNDVTEALSYEKRLKTFSRKRKIELIIENNPSMRDLYSDFWVKL